jgi:hypothetical protein
MHFIQNMQKYGKQKHHYLSHHEVIRGTLLTKSIIRSRKKKYAVAYKS